MRLQLKLDITYGYEEDVDEAEKEFDLQQLEQNLMHLVRIGMAEGVFTADTYAVIESYEVEVN